MNEIFEQHFNEKGFKARTLIQKQTFDLLLDGQSVIGLSPTGSGKTLAFALPLLEKIIPGDGIQLLVLSPSQELAVQTTDVFREWASLLKLKVSSVTGGANLQRQIERLKKKPEIIVGTPGRVLTLVNEGRLKTSEINTLVVDEADELLVGETLGDIRQIEDQLPGSLQYGFFSATSADSLFQISNWFGIDPVTVDVRADDHTQGMVKHGWMVTSDASKLKLLRKLSHLKHFQALVFFNHVSTLEKVAATLKHEGVHAGKIAGHQVQTDRATALRDFRKGKLDLLLVTEVAARGLDIQKLPAVINYDVPEKAINYTHRVGRTGRMGESGFVINFGNDHDIRDVKKIGRSLNLEMNSLVIMNDEVMTSEEAKDVQPIKKTAVKNDNDRQSTRPKARAKIKKTNVQKDSDIRETPLKKKKHSKKHSKRKGMRQKKS
ncbi:DEAD/DEAH box helicase [Pediococcus argentinicus]|uniref:II DNA RNA helicase n=1 Tax=Pediococcus argentinicus TaxID=480391 RepID=A0A0R2N8N9_9LACO|nr:DEAD/DEAH box helicase [Pediococcus argentinicus]KRO22182.1 II DNA RNA helicase [Pediococcus argentinicus]NKZ22497.1 DEAD/DEAH box helicase [Pediococcus argentinicus]GEP20185.1 helicase [Pediococcus argentinicus]